MNDKESVTKESNTDLEAVGMSWNASIDKLLANWCDQAKCFEWMHAEAYDISFKKARKFMISINLLTALSGLSNIIAGGYTAGGFQIAWLFGGLSILVSSLNMLQDKLGYQQNSELHKRLSATWGLIRSKIEEMLMLPPSARRDCKTFIKMIKTDINQASFDGNSLIPQKIKDECYEKFKSVPNFDIPDICGRMGHTQVYMDVVIEQNNSDSSNTSNSSSGSEKPLIKTK
jgi:hypothetical protein